MLLQETMFQFKNIGWLKIKDGEYIHANAEVILIFGKVDFRANNISKEGRTIT